jgi:hypothetical protein
MKKYYKKNIILRLLIINVLWISFGKAEFEKAIVKKSRYIKNLCNKIELVQDIQLFRFFFAKLC